MGNKFEVWEWGATDKLNINSYKYHIQYRGDSFFKALWVMRKLKKAGAGCVKLEWR